MKSNLEMKFKELHQQESPLLIGNVWDVPSARIAEKLNLQAIGTSSAAIAKCLGYEDGEEMTFGELERIVKRITENTTLPLSVDLESGYSQDPMEVTEHIRRLSDLGVVGVNIEDSIVNGSRQLLDAQDFAAMLSEIKKQLIRQNIRVFINARTDTFLLGIPGKVEETKKRMDWYETAGIDGIFVPCIESASDIEEIVSATTLPLNVMCMPNLPDFNTLATLGVKRISMGNFLFDHMYEQFESALSEVDTQQSFKIIF